jgi:hypothetical protein
MQNFTTSYARLQSKLVSTTVLTCTLTLQRLRTLRGVGGRLPFGLPPQLETLEYIAQGAAAQDCYGQTEEAAAAEVIARLGNLVRLTVRRCVWTSLPLSFVSSLPITLQVAVLSAFMYVHLMMVHGAASVSLSCLPAASRGSVYWVSVWAMATIVACLRVTDRSSLSWRTDALPLPFFAAGGHLRRVRTDGSSGAAGSDCRFTSRSTTAHAPKLPRAGYTR